MPEQLSEGEIRYRWKRAEYERRREELMREMEAVDQAAAALFAETDFSQRPTRAFIERTAFGYVTVTILVGVVATVVLFAVAKPTHFLIAASGLALGLSAKRIWRLIAERAPHILMILGWRGEDHIGRWRA